tara:strand:+ start:2338 stop:2970 length:633 start_codon:yes stop_codon:yes gene_type:complete
MESKSKLEQIKDLLFGDSKQEVKDVQLEVAEVVVEETVEVKLEQAKLENGTVIEAEMFEAGQDVFIVSDEEKVPLPVGEYKLEDGKSLVVSEEGVIDSIGEASEEEAPAEEEVAQASEFVTVDEFNKAISEIKSLLTSHDEEILKKHETEKAELSATVDNLETKLSEAPAASKINSSPEAKEKSINMNIISPNRRQNTADRVFDMIFNKK